MTDRELLRAIAKKIAQTVDDPEDLAEDLLGMIEEHGAVTEAEVVAWGEEVW